VTYVVVTVVGVLVYSLLVAAAVIRVIID